MIASKLHQARTFHWVELLGGDARQMYKIPLDFQSWEFLDSQLSECIHQQVSSPLAPFVFELLHLPVLRGGAS